MAVETATDGVKNGIYTENGTMYYYKDGEKYYAGLIRIGDDYYYVNSSFIVVTGSYNITHTHGILPMGVYLFAEDGKMIKNGIFSDSDGLYYYKDGERYASGLVYIDGSYYYAGTGGVLRVNGWFSFGGRSEGISEENILPIGYYYFDNNGKIILDPTKNGILLEDGTLYYYINGGRISAGLVLVDGYYYFARSTGELVVNSTRTISEADANGLMSAGTYEFDSQGRMIKDGILVLPTDSGCICIFFGEGKDDYYEYECFIDNGISFEEYELYIDNGISWDLVY